MLPAETGCGNPFRHHEAQPRGDPEAYMSAPISQKDAEEIAACRKDIEDLRNQLVVGTIDRKEADRTITHLERRIEYLERRGGWFAARARRGPGSS
jgi:hypothetical protein